MSPVDPEISVIIPVHNGEPYLAEAIQSILEQDATGLEVLVVDNASTDATAEVAARFAGVRYFFLEEKGLVNALNFGIEKSKGAWLAFLDADDLWKPGKLVTQLAVFARDPSLDMLFGHVEQFISPELKGKDRQNLAIRVDRLPGRARGTLLISKAAFLQVGMLLC